LSALTKVFVVLLVICTMLFAASMVVFVNHVEDFRAARDQSVAKELAQAARAQKAEDDAKSARDTLADQMRTDQQRVDSIRADLTASQGREADLNVQVTQSKNDLAAREAHITQLTEALKSAEDQTNKWQIIIQEVRAKNDELVAKYRDANVNITELTAKLDATESQRRWLEEQLTDSKNSVAELHREIAAMGGYHPEQQPVEPDQPINGVVKSINLIDGFWWATINVGSADNVQRGMKFNCINRDTGDFLGILTVESIQPNECIGKLEGPKVADVQRGTEVRTRL